MIIQVTLRQLFQMLKESYLVGVHVPCTHCGKDYPALDHEVQGAAETIAERIVMNNLRKDDYKLQQS